MEFGPKTAGKSAGSVMRPLYLDFGMKRAKELGTNVDNREIG